MPISVDSRETFLQAVDVFDSRVDATEAEAWSSPSPCEGWTAGDVLVHVVGNLRALRAALDGADFYAVRDQPVQGSLVDAWHQERARVAPALDDAKAAAVGTVAVGGRAVPLPALVDGLMRDLVIHTWDLARAVGANSLQTISSRRPPRRWSRSPRRLAARAATATRSPHPRTPMRRHASSPCRGAGRSEQIGVGTRGRQGSSAPPSHPQRVF